MNNTIKYFLVCSGIITFLGEGCKKDETPSTSPTLTTADLKNITSSGATAGGTITSNGGANISASGITWSKTSNAPTTNDSIITNTVSSGSFTCNLSNLDFNTTYYIRAFATNSVGTSYGSTVTLNTTNDTTKVRFTYNAQTVIYGIVISPTSGKKWLDRNLGAQRVATASNDAQAYGDLFQWGRQNDGHQVRTSDTTWTQSSTDAPGHNKLIKVQGAAFSDWRNPQNNNLWQGIAATNNPCPSGWHVPTKDEWGAETSITNAATAFSTFKLTVAGYRWEDTKLADADNGGYYWTSQTVGPIAGRYYAYKVYFDGTANSFYTPATSRGQAMSIRCIKD